MLAVAPAEEHAELNAAMPPPIEITTTFVRDPHRRWIYLSLLVLIWPLPMWLLGGLWVALSMAATVALFLFVLRTRRAPVRVDESGISLGGRRIAREAIGSGYVVPATNQATARVELNDRRRHVMVRIDAPEDVGDRILATLGLDASRRAAAFRGRWPLRSLRGALITLVHLGACVLFWKGGGLALIGFAASSILETLLGNRSIVVAGDGISVEHGLGTRWRFVPWSAVTEVRSTRSGITLDLTRGTLLLPAVEDTKGALLARIEEALTLHRAVEAEALGALLARGGRDRAAWLASLSAGSDGYRSVPHDEDRLWRVVESPAAAPTARAAAAVLLTRQGGDATRTRLRVAAEGCASPKLRVVLDEAGSGAEEEAIRAALGEVEDEDEGIEPRRAATRRAAP